MLGVMKSVSFRWGGAERWGIESRLQRRRQRRAEQEGFVYVHEEWERKLEREGQCETELRAEREEEEEMAYESLLCMPQGPGSELEDDDTKGKVATARMRRAEEEAAPLLESDEQWGGRRWIGGDVPICGQVDPEMSLPSADEIADAMRRDRSADTLCGWQSEAVVHALKCTLQAAQSLRSSAVSAADGGIPDIAVGEYSCEDNAKMLADAHVTSLRCCLNRTNEVDIKDINSTDPHHWGEIGPQLGGMVAAYVNTTYNRPHSIFGDPAEADGVAQVPPYVAEHELEEARQGIVCGMQDAQLNEVVINHFAALAAAATAAGCVSIPEWVALRGGEDLIKDELAREHDAPGSSNLLRELEEEILLAALAEISAAQGEYVRNEPCAGSVPQPGGIASTQEILHGAYLFR